MSDKPIIFNSEMVRSILEGRKTQTRRIVKGLNDELEYHDFSGAVAHFNIPKSPCIGKLIECPYGSIGSKLWVRETWGVEPERYIHPSVPHGYGGHFQEEIFFKADDPNLSGIKWKPSIFMPRWASRITLEITDVRVERVQDISEDDAIKEGFPSQNHSGSYSYRAKSWFQYLWDEINLNRGFSWESNPFVWVIEFKKVKGKDE